MMNNIVVLFRHFIVFFVRTFYWLGMLIHMHYECSYHLAEKKIPSIHGQTVGFKLEQFIFDAFPYAPSTALFEVTFLPFSLIQVLSFLSCLCAECYFCLGKYDVQNFRYCVRKSLHQ